MRKITRSEEPEILKLNWQQWGETWKEQKERNPSAQFQWRQHENQKVNHIILPNLRLQTQKHCTFCDNFPVSPPSLETVEHFKPKSKFPLLAYKWDNLFYCCDFCQQKGEDYHDDLLKPDIESYSPKDYFEWNYLTGEIQPNHLATEENQKKAQTTIDLYHLNIAHPSLRKRALHFFIKLRDVIPLDEHPYRDFLSNATPLTV